MTTLFVTGTDTGVGKTIATSLLVRFLKKHGKKFIPYKPIQSGAIWKENKWVAPDPDVYQMVNGFDSMENNCTYLFKKPCSPHLAAELENTQVDVTLLEKIIEILSNKGDGVIVEGAGGLYVPITTDGYCFIDWMEKLRIPVILVTHSGVGTINHTVLSIKALQSRNIPIAGIMMNHLVEEDEDVIIDNQLMIEKITNIPVILSIPYLDNMKDETLDECFQDWNINIFWEAITNGFKTVNGN